MMSHIFNNITFPWKASQSGAHPPVGILVGATVVLTKLLLLLQMEGSSKPQLISFQYPLRVYREEWNKQGFTWRHVGDEHMTRWLTHALVYSHTVFIIISKVGLILIPRGVCYRAVIHPAGSENSDFRLWWMVNRLCVKKKLSMAYLKDLSKFTVMPI